MFLSFLLTTRIYNSGLPKPNSVLARKFSTYALNHNGAPTAHSFVQHSLKSGISYSIIIIACSTQFTIFYIDPEFVRFTDWIITTWDSIPSLSAMGETIPSFPEIKWPFRGINYPSINIPYPKLASFKACKVVNQWLTDPTSLMFHDRATFPHIYTTISKLLAGHPYSKIIGILLAVVFIGCPAFLTYLKVKVTLGWGLIPLVNNLLNFFDFYSGIKVLSRVINLPCTTHLNWDKKSSSVDFVSNRFKDSFSEEFTHSSEKELTSLEDSCLTKFNGNLSKSIELDHLLDKGLISGSNDLIVYSLNSYTHSFNPYVSESEFASSHLPGVNLSQETRNLLDRYLFHMRELDNVLTQSRLVFNAIYANSCIPEGPETFTRSQYIELTSDLESLRDLFIHIVQEIRGDLNRYERELDDDLGRNTVILHSILHMYIQEGSLLHDLEVLYEWRGGRFTFTWSRDVK